MPVVPACSYGGGRPGAATKSDWHQSLALDRDRPSSGRVFAQRVVNAILLVIAHVVANQTANVHAASEEVSSSHLYAPTESLLDHLAPRRIKTSVEAPSGAGERWWNRARRSLRRTGSILRMSLGFRTSACSGS